MGATTPVSENKSPYFQRYQEERNVTIEPIKIQKTFFTLAQS
jgi:hypothetical protein